MNELIRQFAAQANSYAISMNPEQDSYGRSANPTRFQQDRDRKFAELIIKECANVVDEKTEDTGSGVAAGWCEGLDLLKHFGVK